MNGAICLVMVVATAFLGLTIPRMWDQSRDIGGIQESISQIEESQRRTEAELGKIADQLDGIAVRISSLDSDPVRYLASAGVASTNMMAVVRVGAGGKPYLFPKTDAARAMLEDSGIKATPVATGIFGYPAPDYLESLLVGESLVSE